MMPNAFITGSYAYGTPDAESDIDLVVLIDHGETFNVLSRETENKHGVDHYGNLTMYFGNLNLIVLTDPGMFAVWRRGTEELIARRPVSRQEAVDHLSRLREEYLDTPTKSFTEQLTSSPKKLRPISVTKPGKKPIKVDE